MVANLNSLNEKFFVLAMESPARYIKIVMVYELNLLKTAFALALLMPRLKMIYNQMRNASPMA